MTQIGQKLPIPPAALAAQSRSSDPSANVWVSANAGSGKTHVLTERVIRLLLRGTPPARILCLTYTKAAAAVMQSRIFNRLSRWTSLTDAALTEELRLLDTMPPDRQKLDQARRLFARALETPGGLKIQTIHAFCESLLHQFPLEANIPGHFELMDDTAQATAAAQVKKQLFTEIYHSPGSPLDTAFQLILQKAGEDGLTLLLAETLAKRQILRGSAAVLAQDGQAVFTEIFCLTAQMKAAAAKGLDIKTALAEQMRRAALFNKADLDKIAALGGARAQDFIGKLHSAARETDAEKLSETLLAAYFTKDAPRDAAWLFGKKALAAWPQLAELFAQKAAALAELADSGKAAALAELNLAAYRLADALLRRYQALKQALGLLDFGDLISRTLALLKRKDAGQWVQYRLDKGIDHILVDEAQDTGPEQWEIIRLLSQEFFAGEGAREDLQRSIFAVGDEKQSIYSFQGAAPQDFAENGAYTAYKAKNARRLFRHERLNFSFRSTQDVLAAVDAVFALPQTYQGLSAANEQTVHTAIRVADQGYVDFWQPYAAEKQSEPEDWTENLAGSISPATLLADNITETIAHWLRSKEILPGKARPIQTGDIMVLVRKRGDFVHALARALKNRSIPVAGADRLRLTDHIAVRDLMALGNFVLQPRDDLSLAAVLKSPLFNISEETLLTLAATRKGTLFAALEQAAEQRSLPAEQEILTQALEKLRAYRAFADIKPVYEFYDKILAEDGGRRRFLSRLGNEASDILDAFLDYCLQAQQSSLPGLQSFLRDLSQNSPEIKRELDQNRNEIRIMTVHAAKGLEAPIVFLVDGGSAIWHSRHAPCLLPQSVPKALRTKYRLPAEICLWLPKAAYKTRAAEAILAQLKTKAEEEYRRLLYVGMTRAEDRLIVCGYYGAKQPPDTWLALVSAALAPQAEAVSYPLPSISAKRYWQQKPQAAALHSASAAESSMSAAEALPDFLTRAAPSEPLLPRPLAPSGAAAAIMDEDTADPDIMRRSPILPYFPAAKTEETAAQNPLQAKADLFGVMEKGTFIHRLLQYLPQIAPQNRRRLAAAYLKARLGADNAALAADISAHIFRILEDEHFAPLFSAGSRAETALMGVITVKGQQRAVSGRIDRLAVFDTDILFADYKTGRAPADAAAVPRVYKMQMALYAALLSALYPQKNIKALLIYTEEGAVFSFAAAELLPLLR